MAQTTGAMSTSAALVEVRTDGVKWPRAGTCLVSTSYSGGEQMVGEQNTQDGKAPVVTHANKFGATTVEVTALYTEVSTEAWDIVHTQWTGSDQTVYFRYSPKGGAGGSNLYTAADDSDAAFP